MAHRRNHITTPNSFPATEQQQFPNNGREAPNISFHLGLTCQPDSPRLLSSCCLLRQGAEGGWGRFGVDFCTSAAAKHCDNSSFEYVLDLFQKICFSYIIVMLCVLLKWDKNSHFQRNCCQWIVNQHLKTTLHLIIVAPCLGVFSLFVPAQILSVCQSVYLSACLWSVLCLNSLTC